MNLKKNIFWDLIGRFSTTFFSLFTSIVLTRLLDPEDFGIVGIAMAVQGVASIFINLGFTNAIIQKSYTANQVSSFFWLNAGIALFISLLLYFLSGSIGNFYHDETVTQIIQVNSALFFLSSFGMVPMALLSKNMEFKKINVRNTLVALGSGVIGIVLAYNGFGVWALVLQNVINGLFGVLLLYIVCKWKPILYFNFKEIKDGINFGKYFFYSGILEGISSRLDVFLIGRAFSNSTLGLYTRAQGLVIIARNLSSTSLLSVLYPAFVKIKDDRVETENVFKKYYSIIAFLFCLISGIGFILALPVFNLLFGERWNASAVYFQLLILSAFAYPLSSLMLTVVEANGNSKGFFKAEVLKKIIILPIYFVLFYFNVEVFLVALFFVNLLSLGINVNFLKREIAVTNQYLFRELAACALPGLGIPIFLNYYFGFDSSMINTIVLLISYITIYLFFQYLNKSAGYNHIYKILIKYVRR